MTKALQITLCLCALALTGALLLVSWHAVGMLDALHLAAWNVSVATYEAKPTVQKANATLDAINAPCVGFHGSVTCGPIAQLSQTEKNVGILAGQGAEQIKQSAKLVDAASEAVTGAAADVHTLAVAGTGTLDESKRTIAAAQPLLASLTRTSDASTLAVQHFDALIQSRDIAETLHHASEVTISADEIAQDGRRVADDATRRYFTPQPWYRRALPYVTTGAKIAAYALPWP